MYNGIGLATVRGSGTSGYVQTNKFNLNRKLPAKPVNSTSDPSQLQEPQPTQANDAILEHNRKREVERKLLELEDILIEKGFGEEEVAERLTSKRHELEAQAQVEDSRDKTAETHELAKRKARELDKLRAAFGISEDTKEGQAFDRDLQEQLKAQRIAEREAQKEAKEEEARKRAKAVKKAEKERKKAEKRKAKEDKKSEALKVKAAEKQRAERAAREAERAKREAEAKERRQRELQARLGPRVESDRNKERAQRSSRDAHGMLDRHRPSEQPALERFDPNERYIPREPTPERYLPGSTPDAEATEFLPAHALSVAAPGVAGPSLSPTPIPRRSGTPSPSPAKVAASKKRPPPPRAPSPERSGPPVSPPPRKRNRLESSSISPAPPTFRNGIPPSAAQRDEVLQDPEQGKSEQIGEAVVDKRPDRGHREPDRDRRARGGESDDLERGSRDDRSRGRRDYDADRYRHGYGSERSRREYDRYDRREKYR